MAIFCDEKALWKSIILRLLFVLMLIARIGTPSATAQTLYGNLTGNVTDASNAALPNATISIRNVDTGFSRTGTTDGSGNYQLTDLQPGTYDITISAQSFGESITKGVPIGANQTKRIDAILAAAGVSQTVEVNTAPPALQTDRADVNYEITSTQVAQLPTTSTAGRNFQGLYRLIPGIPPPQEQNSQSGNPGRTQAVNANGVSNTTNSTKIDGAAVGYPWLTSIVAYIPPTDSIESANLVTNSFNAEQGTAGGAAANLIVKSGTNSFHGAAWEYNSISQFNARNYFTRVSTTPVIPKNIYNEYGANIGGPILKGKLFFFFDYNKVSLRQFKSGFQTLPLSSLRNGDFSSVAGVALGRGIIYDPLTGNADGSNRTPFPNNVIPRNRLSPAAVKLLSLVPAENNINGDGTSNNYAGGGVLQYDRGAYDTKINFNPTNATTIFGRYSVQRSLIFDPVTLGAAVGTTWDGGQPGRAPGTIQNIGLGATHTFTPHLLLDANAGFVRINLAAVGPDYGTNQGLDLLSIPGTNGASLTQSGLPVFNMSNGLSGLGNTNVSQPFQFRDMQYVGNVNATYIRGDHTMRFGGEYTHSAINQSQTNGNSPRGLFQFSGGATGNNSSTAARSTPAASPTYYRTIADYLLGFPNQLGKTVQYFNPNGPRFSSFAFYAQDTWKATSNLTVNYGLRYEYYPFANRDHTGVFRFDPATSNVLIGGRGSVPTNTGENVGHGLVVPRLGVNYRINDKTVLRSGFGFTVDPDNFRYFRDAYPALITLNNVGVNTYVPAGALSGPGATVPNANTLPSGVLGIGIPTVNVPDISAGTVPLPFNYSTQTVPKDFRRGYIESWNLFIDQSFTKGIVGTIGYVGTHHVRQVVGLDINAGTIGSPLGNLSRPLKTNTNAPGNVNGVPRTITTQILQVTPFGDEEYSGLQAQLTDRQLRSFQFGYAYTWSHAMNVFDENSTLGGLIFNNPALLKRNYANSAFDRTHVNALWTVWQIPVGPGRQFLTSGFLGRLIGGFDLNTITTYYSGAPFQLTDNSYSGFGDTTTPDQISKPVLGAKYRAAQATGPTALTYFDNSAGYYKAVGSAAARIGNVGRNTIRGPGVFNLDAALTRNIPIYREFNIVLKAESFDVTNTPQFANPGVNVNAPSSFGVITTSNAARTLRFSGRVTF